MYKIVYVHRENDIELPLYTPGDMEYCLTNCRLDVECGKSGTLTMGVPEENPAKYDIVFPTDEVIVYRDEKEIWRGRPITEERDFYNTGTLTCEGILSYLYDTYFPPFEFEGSPKEFLQMVLDYHNSLVEERKQFELGEITVVDNNDYINRSSIYYSRTLQVLTEKLINDTLGGYFRVRIEDGVRYLDYLETYATEASQAVEYGENLLDIAQNIEYTDTASVILPLGARIEDEDGVETDEYLTIASVNDGSIYYIDDEALARYGWICVSNEWEDVTLPENLLTRAKSYLEQCTNAVSSMTVNAVDLSLISKDKEPIDLGDYVLIRSDPHGINQYVELTAMMIYPMEPENDVLTFGSDTASLSDSQRNTDRNIQSALGSLSMRVTNLTATVIDAVYANIETIVSSMITTDVIKAAVADMGFVTADYLEAYYLTADMIEANYLSVGSAVITDLTAFEASVTALLAGQEGVGELQAIHLTADNVIIDDAVIDSILASNATIATLLAGNIYTDYIKIANNEGENLLIDGATIQINDGTVIRVQIGLDSDGNYNFYLFNEEGEAIWDALGLTEAGLIGNGAIIRDIAVADDANISGYKLNIQEVGTYLNESGYTLEAAQVTIDGETLDYKLTQMSEQIEGINFEGLVTFVTYFCLWGSAEEQPPDEADFTSAYTDEAETDHSWTDWYDYMDLWSTDEPLQEYGLYKWLRYLCYYADGHTEWTDCYCITDDFIREQTTVLQTQLEVVQGQISAKIWMSDITETINTTISDMWAEINIWLGEIETQVGSMSTSMEILTAQVATQDITINGIVSTVSELEAHIDNIDMNGVEWIDTYFCAWYSPTEAPCPENDFTPAYTDEAETDSTWTDWFDYWLLWSTDEPSWEDGIYIWVRYMLTYQDGHTEWSTPYCLSDEYARKQVEGAYSEIAQLADSITLSVTGVLGDRAQIKLTVDKNEFEQDLDLTEVRQAFANDESAVEISAGLILFASNTIVIESDYFKVSADGVITATAGYIGGWTIGAESLYNGTDSMESTIDGMYVGIDGIRSYGNEEYTELTSGHIESRNNEDTGLYIENGRIQIYEEDTYIGEIGVGYYQDTRSSAVDTDIYTGPVIRATEDAMYIGFGHGEERWSHVYQNHDFEFDYVINYYYTSHSNAKKNIFGYSERHIFYGNTVVDGTLTAEDGTIISDERLKTDISPILDKSDEVEKFIDMITPVTFKFKQDTGRNFDNKVHFGLIAQDVQKALTGAGLDDDMGIVSVAGSPSYEDELGISYNEFVGILLYEVKELRKEIKEMKGE